MGGEWLLRCSISGWGRSQGGLWDRVGQGGAPGNCTNAICGVWQLQRRCISRCSVSQVQLWH